MTSSWERGTAKLSSSQSISTNISCSQSSAIAVSAYSSFLFVVGIDDGLHGDAALSYLVRFDLGSSKPLNHCKTLHLFGFSSHTMNTVVRVHNLCNIGGNRPVFIRNLPEPGSARRGNSLAPAVLRVLLRKNLSTLRALALPPCRRSFAPMARSAREWGAETKRPGGVAAPRGPDHRRYPCDRSEYSPSRESR